MKDPRQALKGYIDSRYQGWDITIALRYLPIAEDLKKIHKEGEIILEVGSEITGITPYLKKEVTGVDVSFDYSKKNKYLKPVKGSVLKLPFKNKSVDYCLSVDVLEHIPENKREKAIKEMVRVTRKKIYLAFPTSKDSERVDKELDEYYKRKHGSSFQYLKEHVTLGLPNQQRIEKLLRSFKEFKLIIYPNTNLKLWKLLLRWGFSNEQLKASFYRRSLLLTPLLKHFNFGKTYRQLYVLERITQ